VKKDSWKGGRDPDSANVSIIEEKARLQPRRSALKRDERCPWERDSGRGRDSVLGEREIIGNRPSTERRAMIGSRKESPI